MELKKTSLYAITLTLVLAFVATPIYYQLTQGYVGPDQFVNRFWSLVPAVLAIALALITKKVYSSLFLGILAGGVYWAGFSFEGTVNNIIANGFAGSLTGDNIGNFEILVFLVFLGVTVALMNKAGGSMAFADWASAKVKSRVGAQIATVVLGILVFVDDYFNCLTVGSVMRPVTDRYKVSRAKLAYIIDSTAAPVCIIAPVSSWAAAVSGFVPGADGFRVFLSTIPYNFYAFLAVSMVILVAYFRLDIGPMRLSERKARDGDQQTAVAIGDGKSEGYVAVSREGSCVWDLILPIVTLIVFCIFFMEYTGGIFAGVNFVEAMSNCDPYVSLAVGSLFAILVTVVHYLARRVLSVREVISCIPVGFKAMVPAILILCFAWTLKGMTDGLGSSVFVHSVVVGHDSLMNFLPAIFFLVGAAIAFSTGTSWGTFGILIPIVVSVFYGVDDQLMVIAISACMAGAVCGDHCSPISDTTIMSSAGAQCSLIEHVRTQLPYVLVAAGVSFVSFIIVGFARSWLICLPLSILMLVAVVYIMRKTLYPDGTGSLSDGSD